MSVLCLRSHKYEMQYPGKWQNWRNLPVCSVDTLKIAAISFVPVSRKRTSCSFSAIVLGTNNVSQYAIYDFLVRQQNLSNLKEDFLLNMREFWPCGRNFYAIFPRISYTMWDIGLKQATAYEDKKTPKGTYNGFLLYTFDQFQEMRELIDKLDVINLVHGKLDLKHFFVLDSPAPRLVVGWFPLDPDTDRTNMQNFYAHLAEQTIFILYRNEVTVLQVPSNMQAASETSGILGLKLFPVNF